MLSEVDFRSETYFQSASDVLRICAYMYTMSRASLCEEIDVYIGNFGGYNAKGKIKQDAELSQRDRAAGCVIVFAKSRRLELEDNILRHICPSSTTVI